MSDALSRSAAEALSSEIREIARRNGELQQVLRAVFRTVGVRRESLAAVLAACREHLASNPGDPASEKAVNIMVAVSRMSVFEGPKLPSGR